VRLDADDEYLAPPPPMTTNRPSGITARTASERVDPLIASFVWCSQEKPLPNKCTQMAKWYSADTYPSGLSYRHLPSMTLSAVQPFAGLVINGKILMKNALPKKAPTGPCLVARGERRGGAFLINTSSHRCQGCPAPYHHGHSHYFRSF
jgi:hypothetical protein